MALIEVHWVDYTNSALHDRFLSALCNKCSVAFIEEEVDNWGSTRSIHINRPYIEQATRKLYCINVFKPPPKYEIDEKDIPDDVGHAFDEMGDKAMDTVVTNVVRSIFISVDPVYFWANGIWSKVRWRIAA